MLFRSATQTKSINGRTVRTIQGLAAAATTSARQPLNLYRGRYGPGVQPTHFQKPDEWDTWGLDEEQDTKVPATTTQEEHDYEPPKKKLFKGKVEILAKSFEKYLSLTVNENKYISENNIYPHSSTCDIEGRKQYGRFCDITGDNGNVYLHEINEINKDSIKYIKTFDIVFIDSLNFLKESLENLKIGRAHV